jgi:hypothetical protein
MWITSHFQKADRHDQTVSQHWSGDLLKCPVQLWTAIVRRLWAYPGTTINTTVNTIQTADGKISALSANYLLQRLR